MRRIDLEELLRDSETFDSLATMSLFSQSGGIAGGVAQALFTTQMGLVVAIPGLVIGRLQASRQVALEGELDALVELGIDANRLDSIGRGDGEPLFPNINRRNRRRNRRVELPFAELPASPCLASRLYTGTRVTAERLRAVEASEALVRSETGIEVVRCRIREDAMLVEVSAADRAVITPELLAAVHAVARRHEATVSRVELDARPYAPGRAFVRSA